MYFSKITITYRHISPLTQDNNQPTTTKKMLGLQPITTNQKKRQKTSVTRDVWKTETTRRDQSPRYGEVLPWSCCPMFLVPRNLFSHVPFRNDEEGRTRKQICKRRGRRFFLPFFLVCVFFGEGGCDCVLFWEKWNAFFCWFLFNEFFLFLVGAKNTVVWYVPFLGCEGKDGECVVFFWPVGVESTWNIFPLQFFVVFRYIQIVCFSNSWDSWKNEISNLFFILNLQFLNTFFRFHLNHGEGYLVSTIMCVKTKLL